LLTTTKKTFQSVSHQVFQNNDLRIQTPAGGSFAYSPSYWSPCLSGRGQKPAHCQCSAGQPRWASDTGTAWPPLGPLSPPGQTEKRGYWIQEHVTYIEYCIRVKGLQCVGM
jgi:hypothetical protein